MLLFVYPGKNTNQLGNILRLTGVGIFLNTFLLKRVPVFYPDFDSRADGEVVQGNAGTTDCLGEALDRRADSTSGAPDVREPVRAEQMLHGMLFDLYTGHCTASSIAFWMTAGS